MKQASGQHNFPALFIPSHAPSRGILKKAAMDIVAAGRDSGNVATGGATDSSVTGGATGRTRREASRDRTNRKRDRGQGTGDRGQESSSERCLHSLQSVFLEGTIHVIGLSVATPRSLMI